LPKDVRVDDRFRQSVDRIASVVLRHSEFLAGPFSGRDQLQALPDG